MEPETSNPISPLITLLILILYSVAMCKSVRKAGFGWGMVFFAVCPLINVVGFLVFAFKEWPIHKEKRLHESESPSGNTATPAVINNSIVQK